MSEGNEDYVDMPNAHLVEVCLGDLKNGWVEVSSFYLAWESFTSSLSFAWVDVYMLDDLMEASNRYVCFCNSSHRDVSPCT